MSDPIRLLEEWDDDAGRAALRLAARDAPPPGARERAGAVVVAALATSAVTTVGAIAEASTGGAVGASAARGSLGLLKFLGIASLLGVGAVVGASYFASSSPPSAGPSVSSAKPSSSQASAVASAPELPAPSVIVATALPSASVPSARSPVPQPSVPAPRGSDGDTTLAAELASLDQARVALAGGQPARALGLLDAHAARFPRGVLATEATVLRIEALIGAGDRPSAVALAHRFLASNPMSPYAPRVRSLIGEADPP